jgi:hypothetical protein
VTRVVGAGGRYAFFIKHLQQQPSSGKQRAPVTDATEWWPNGVGNLSALFSPNETIVTSTGQVRTAPECSPNLIYHSFTEQIAGAKITRLQQRRTTAAAPAFFREIRRVAADVSGFRGSQRPNASVVVDEQEQPPHTARAAGVASPAPPVVTMIAGEGHCTIAITACTTAECKTASEPVVLLGSDQNAPKPELGANLSAAGYTVIHATVCGFDKPRRAFPITYKSMAAIPDIARNLNRSVVGIHAADILRVAEWVRSTYSSRPVATVATGQLHSAALHAALLGQPGAVGALALLENTASYEEITASLLYQTPSSPFNTSNPTGK